MHVGQHINNCNVLDFDLTVQAVPRPKDMFVRFDRLMWRNPVALMNEKSRYERQRDLNGEDRIISARHDRSLALSAGHSPLGHPPSDIFLLDTPPPGQFPSPPRTFSPLLIQKFENRHQPILLTLTDLPLSISYTLTVDRFIL